jgi:hypothetical protein
VIAILLLLLLLVLLFGGLAVFIAKVFVIGLVLAAVAGFAIWFSGRLGQGA